MTGWKFFLRSTGWKLVVVGLTLCLAAGGCRGKSSSKRSKPKWPTIGPFTSDDRQYEPSGGLRQLEVDEYSNYHNRNNSDWERFYTDSGAP